MSHSHMLPLEYMQSAIEHPQQKLYCKDLHPGTACEHKIVSQFFAGCKSVSKMYLIVHLVPFLLFKRKKVKENPKKQLINLLIGFIKSLLFAGGYSALVRLQICLWTKFHTYQSGCTLPIAITSGISLIFQPKGRQAQIGLFCLNKSLQTGYNMLMRRGYNVRIPYGECLLMAVSMAILSYHYFNNNQVIRDNYRQAMDKLLKDC